MLLLFHAFVFLEQLFELKRHVFLHEALEPVFDCVFGSVLNDFGDVGPAESLLLHIRKELQILGVVPLTPVYVRVQIVEPPFSALFSWPVEQLVGQEEQLFRDFVPLFVLKLSD